MNNKKLHFPDLKVVFDTSVLFTEAATSLLRQEVADLIKQNKHLHDLKISWYLPEIVKHERQYQMSKRAKTFLNTVKSLEEVLGYPLDITEGILRQKVEAIVNGHVTSYGLNLLKINYKEVNWESMMLNAAYRQPPFESKEKEREKGFRDALIVESFLQLVEMSPKSSESTLIVLVSNDTLLGETVKSRTSGSVNVRVLKTLEELKGLINTISSHVDEFFIAEVQKKAFKYFFLENDSSTFIHKAQVINRIKTDFKDILGSLPEGAELRENGTFYLDVPQFIKKEARRIFWVTRIQVASEAFKFEPTKNPPALTALSTAIERLPPIGGIYPSSVFVSQQPAIPVSASGTITSFISPFTMALPSFAGSFGQRQKILVKSGRSIFDVFWSVNRSSDGRFSRPEIDNIIHIETVWDES